MTTKDAVGVDRREKTTRPAGDLALVVPEYGPVEALLGFGLFYVVVTIVHDALRTDLLAVAPEWVPEPLGFAAAAALWFVGAVILLSEAARQVAANPRWYRTAPERRRAARRLAPTRGFTVLYALVGLLGTVFAVAGVPAIEPTFRGIAAAVVTRTIPTIDATLLAQFLVFWLGWSLATRAVDRLSIGALRAVVAGAVR